MSNLIPQTHRLAWWEDFGQENRSQLIPSGDRSRRRRMEPCPCLFLNWEWEQMQANCIGGGSVDLQCITHLKKDREVQIGIFHRCVAKLWLLHHLYECRIEFKIVGHHGGIVMLGVSLWAPKVTYSRRVRLWSFSYHHTRSGCWLLKCFLPL